MKDNMTFGFRPLYRQVRETLTERLADGRWQPGTMLPSEQELARELGVSQGTVRKALDSMTADRILVRKQGKGTFVAEFEESRVLFQFIRLYPDQGERLFPISKVTGTEEGEGTEAELTALALRPHSRVFRVRRVRYHGEFVLLRETLTMPASLYPGLLELPDIPNNVYRLYSQKWGINVTRVSERLKAVAATEPDSQDLGCLVGLPLLEIERTTFNISNQPVEFRVSRCLTDRMHYASDVT